MRFLKSRICYAYGVFLIIAIIALIFPFCNVDPVIPFDHVKNTLHTFIDDAAMQEQTEKNVSKNYLVKREEYKDIYSYGPISYMNVEEITVFFQPDDTLRTTLFDKTKEHIKRQISVFEGYGEVQTKMLKDAYVAEKGEYVICIISENSVEAAEAFRSLF